MKYFANRPAHMVTRNNMIAHLSMELVVTTLTHRLLRLIFKNTPCHVFGAHVFSSFSFL